MSFSDNMSPQNFLYFIELSECCIPQTGYQTLKDQPRWRVKASPQLLPNAKSAFISLLMRFEEYNRMVQRRPEGQEATDTSWARKILINYKEKIFTMKVVKHWNWGPGRASLLRDIQNRTGKIPEQPDLALKMALLWAGSWAIWPPEVPSDLNYSVIPGSWIPAAERSRSHCSISERNRKWRYKGPLGDTK